MPRKDEPVPPITQSNIRYREHNGGPWVIFAAFCEIYMEDRNDAVPSLIRIVDRFTTPRPPTEVVVSDESGTRLDAIVGTTLRTTLAMQLASDAARGKHYIRVRIEGPDGLKQDIPGGLDALFEGEDRGVRLALPLEMNVTIEGLYWVEILVDDRIATRTPLRVIFR